MNATLTHLQCDGDEALGPLIVGIIRPGLQKYEGKSKPVFSFPTGELQLRDVQIRTDDQIRVTALFGAGSAETGRGASRQKYALP
jgi:hypothetical protein